jgi:hypothetical protein
MSIVVYEAIFVAIKCIVVTKVLWDTLKTINGEQMSTPRDGVYVNCQKDRRLQSSLTPLSRSRPIGTNQSTNAHE